MTVDRAERERKRQNWQALLDADKANCSPARLRTIMEQIEEGNHVYVRSPRHAGHYHLAYFLRTGKKFLDLQDAEFHPIRDRRKIIQVVNLPQARCKKCRMKKPAAQQRDLWSMIKKA